VLVQIEYQEPVRLSGDVFSLRVPLVVARAITRAGGADRRPASRQPRLGHGQPIRCPDRAASSRRCSIRASTAPVNPVTITVRLQAGFALGEVKSHHHAVKIEDAGENVRLIKLDEGTVPADRDFELTWKPPPAPRRRSGCSASASAKPTI
jgi:Ca-activated chloride channel family protein